MNDICNHRWRKVYEEVIFIGPAAIGWDCLVCGIFINNNDMSPNGLGGTITKAQKLVGIHGGKGNCSDGSVYKEQLVDENGVLTIIR